MNLNPAEAFRMRRYECAKLCITLIIKQMGFDR